MLIGITTGGKVGLGVTALVFIGFALAASFLFPRRSPDFPGERLRGFIALAALLFVAVIAAVVFFAAEEEGEPAGGEATPTQVETETTGATTEAPPEGGAEGDPAAGKGVFADGGCGGCHTLEAAGAAGSVGPNLDEAKPDAALVVERVTNGMGVMPSFADQFSEQQIQDVAAYVVQSTSG